MFNARKIDESCHYCGEQDLPTEPFVHTPDTFRDSKTESVFGFRCQRCKELIGVSDVLAHEGFAGMQRPTSGQVVREEQG